MKKQIVKTMFEKFCEFKTQTFLAHTYRESVAETKRRLLLRRFPRAWAQAPGR